MKRIKAAVSGMKYFDTLSKGLEEDSDLVIEFYKAMSEVIGLQRRRIGGNWAIGQAVTSRALKCIPKYLNNFKAHLFVKRTQICSCYT